MSSFTRVADEGLMRFMKLHEMDIAGARDRNDAKSEWNLLYHAFWQLFKHPAGKGKK